MSQYTTAQIIKEPESDNLLWISGQIFAHNLISLENHRIGAVCSIGSDAFNFPPNIQHLYLQIEDTEDEEISKVFDEAFNFIQTNKATKNVLVHCIAGVSRSATIVAYYLMGKYGWTVQESLQKIRQSRPFIRPNGGFYRQLKQAEMKMKQLYPKF